MEYLKGKGAQINVPNSYLTHHVDTSDFDGLDEELIHEKPKTEVYYETPKKIISYNSSPDVGMEASVNPYQGCEHGCVYCYARNSHEYWGFSAGLDFETKIIVKPEAPKLLEQSFLAKSYRPKVIMLSGNTDCYQPLEKKYKITRKLLKVCLKYRHPIGILTKNSLVTRDADLLQELASLNLVQVNFSITSCDEKIRRILEPRTASAAKKFKAIRDFTDLGIPVGIMNAPIIPAINHYEIPDVLEKAAASGAISAGYTVVRLNGKISRIFKDWLDKNFPDRADKVWHQIQSLHGGEVNDSQFGRRNAGEGEIAKTIRQLFSISKKKHFKNRKSSTLDLTKFRRNGNYQLF
ncbi:MAG: PA0069 family radical SAM protein [Bacteroidota bacterium]